MRYVLGFFPPDRLFAIVDALSEQHIHGLTVSDARGFGQEHDAAHPEHHEHVGVEDACHLLVALYTTSGHSGRRGDGKIFILPVLDALRMKTGERGEEALGPAAER